MIYSKVLFDIFYTDAILKHMHILQSFCIAMFPVLFRHNKTPKVFCLTFGVHIKQVREGFSYLPEGRLKRFAEVFAELLGKFFLPVSDLLKSSEEEAENLRFVCPSETADELSVVIEPLDTVGAVFHL